jgi:biopolymer transport protein ExbB
MALFMLLAAFAVPDAHAWYDGKWKSRVKVQFDASSTAAGITDTLSDIPVLVRLHGGNFSFSEAKADGSDIRFVGADDKSPLKYHIEKFDPNEEIALIWVKVPRISGGSNQDAVWMYYGNPSAADGQDTGGTYDVNQVAVFHLNESEGNPRDATSYGNHTAAFTGKPGLPSVIGTGVQFGGTAEMMTVARSASLDFTKGFTFSAWARPSQPAGKAAIFSWEDGKQSLIIGIENGKVFCSIGQTSVKSNTASLNADTWYHLAVTANPGGQIALYVNGSEAASGTFKGDMPSPVSDIFIGAAANGQNAFAGQLDEIQLSNTARPAGWMMAAFQGQGPDGALTSVMEVEAGEGGGESLTIELMKVIVRTITLDGWVIIGILFIMGCASLYIFGKKITLLRETRKGNALFSKSFRGSEHIMSLLEKDQEFNGSGLYRIYLAGCEELAAMFERKSEAFKGGKRLSETILSGSRAAIDKAAMYESRKLTDGMVIMNMSVAGGPFLGLLGTVWGVMNTFASLAESGEASLSAIAPGVASALACTLAGLLIAIPALFGSSYITGKIKDLNADANIFLDDFIRRLEEERGEEA